MKRNTIHAGLIGCGDISSRHLKTYAATGIKLIALCDIVVEKAEEKKAEFGTSDTRVVKDYREMLKIQDIDLITIATHVAQHAPLTIDALKAGKHVVCEKPSTLSISENKNVIQAAKQAKRHAVFFSSRMRWGASVLAREYIQNGELGDIYRVHVKYFRDRGRPGVDMLTDSTWFASKKLAGGGIVMDMGQYFMDMILHLLDWPRITTVSATTFQGFPHNLPADVVYDVEEHCTILARTDRDITLTFDFANISHQPITRSIMILGTKGGIVMDDEHYFRYYTEKGGPWHQMEHKSLWRDNAGSNDHIYEDMIKAIQGKNVDIGTTPEQALWLNELTFMAYQSAKEGREINRKNFKPN